MCLAVNISARMDSVRFHVAFLLGHLCEIMRTVAAFQAPGK